MRNRITLFVLLACFCTAGVIGPEFRHDNLKNDLPFPEDDLLPLMLSSFNIVQSSRNRTYEINYINNANAMVVEGTINSVPIWFVVDTGASFVTISPEIARKAGIDSEGSNRIQLQTANGIVSAPLVSIDSIVADNVEMRDVQAVIHSPTANPNIGLLGMSYFGQHQITIDHEKHTIVLKSK